MKWQSILLREVCSVTPGFAFKSSEFSDSGIPVVKISNIRDDYKVDLSDVQCWPQELFSDKLAKFILKDKDILIAMTGATAGKMGRVRTEQPLLLNQRVAKIEAVRINPDFLWFALSSEKYRERFFLLAGGAAQPNMSGGQIETVEITFPPLSIQEKIADILSTYDDLIENNNRRMALLEESARLLYREWFVRLRFPGREHSRLVNGVPEGWERKKLGDVLTLNYGKSLKEDSRLGGEYPVYGSSGIVGGHNEALVKGPGIIVGRKGNVGATYWSEKDYWPIDTVYFIDNEQCSFFLYHNLLNQPFQSSDGAVPGLNRNYACSLSVLIPNKTLSDEFESRVAPIYKQTFALQAMNKKLQTARDLLLPRLMNGEIAV